jgi:hypothetical protein
MDGVVRQAIRAAGEVLLTVGLVGLLFIGYLVWGTGLRAASAQRALSSELNQQWQRPGGRGDADHRRRHGGPMVLRLPLGRASPADRLLRLQRLRFKIPVPLGDPLGVTLGEPVSDGGALADAPFCT